MSLSNNYPNAIPSLVLDFANTKKLDPRVTFTRASTATFYDGKTVAKAEENLLTFSEQFDNAAWTTEAVVKTANSAVAPDGNTTADTLADDATNTVHQTRNATGVSIPNTAVTASVFLKNNTRQFGCLSIYDGSAYHGIVVDLTNGTITQTNGTLTSSSVTSVGNGWYRLAITRTINASTFLSVTTSNSGTPSLSNGRPSYTGDGSSIYLWGAQLEIRSSVTAYTASTTAPITNYIPALQTAASGVARFEHNPVTGESLGLEIEEQRTNLLQRSEEFNDAYWTKSNSSISANVIVAPDGTLTGDKIVENTATAAHVVQRTGITITSGTAYTFSVYAKAAERTLIQLQYFDGSINRFPIFSLIDGTKVVDNGIGTSWTSTNVGNGWWRFTITATSASTSAGVYIYPALVNTNAYTGDGFSGIYIWGAQLEAGSFATSYIKTEGSQVTRNADSASMTGTNFSSWYRADEGSIYLDAVSVSTANDDFFYQFASGSWLNAIDCYTASSGTRIEQRVLFNNTNAALFQTTLAVGSSNKYCLSYKFNDTNSAVNGTAGTTDTSVGIPVVNYFVIGNAWTASNSMVGTIKKLAYYPARLTNAQLQAITSA